MQQGWGRGSGRWGRGGWSKEVDTYTYPVVVSAVNVPGHAKVSNLHQQVLPHQAVPVGQHTRSTYVALKNYKRWRKNITTKLYKIPTKELSGHYSLLLCVYLSSLQLNFSNNTLMFVFWYTLRIKMTILRFISIWIEIKICNLKVH